MGYIWLICCALRLAVRRKDWVYNCTGMAPEGLCHGMEWKSPGIRTLSPVQEVSGPNFPASTYGLKEFSGSLDHIWLVWEWDVARHCQDIISPHHAIPSVPTWTFDEALLLQPLVLIYKRAIWWFGGGILQTLPTKDWRMEAIQDGDDSSHTWIHHVRHLTGPNGIKSIILCPLCSLFIHNLLPTAQNKGPKMKDLTPSQSLHGTQPVNSSFAA